MFQVGSIGNQQIVDNHLPNRYQRSASSSKLIQTITRCKNKIFKGIFLATVGIVAICIVKRALDLLIPIAVLLLIGITVKANSRDSHRIRRRFFQHRLGINCDGNRGQHLNNNHRRRVNPNTDNKRPYRTNNNNNHRRRVNPNTDNKRPYRTNNNNNHRRKLNPNTGNKGPYRTHNNNY